MTERIGSKGVSDITRAHLITSKALDSYNVGAHALYINKADGIIFVNILFIFTLNPARWMRRNACMKHLSENLSSGVLVVRRFGWG